MKLPLNFRDLDTALFMMFARHSYLEYTTTQPGRNPVELSVFGQSHGAVERTVVDLADAATLDLFLAFPSMTSVLPSRFILDGRLIVVGDELEHLDAVQNVFVYDPQEMGGASCRLAGREDVDVAGAIAGKIVTVGGPGGNRGVDIFIGAFAP